MACPASHYLARSSTAPVTILSVDALADIKDMDRAVRLGMSIAIALAPKPLTHYVAAPAVRRFESGLPI